jgi:hypothetical protein
MRDDALDADGTGGEERRHLLGGAGVGEVAQQVG